jgi:hypothetical protein
MFWGTLYGLYTFIEREIFFYFLDWDLNLIQEIFLKKAKNSRFVESQNLGFVSPLLWTPHIQLCSHR